MLKNIKNLPPDPGRGNVKVEYELRGLLID
jgi:hypothetical protein